MRVMSRVMKKYINMALVYTIVGLVFGVFYREFTKLNGFTGKTVLSVMHTHYLMLGMFFFLVLLILEKVFSFTGEKTGRIILCYNIGLNITGLSFLVRGITQVFGTELSSGMDAAISGFAGLGHIFLGVCMVLVLFRIKKVVVKQ